MTRPGKHGDRDCKVDVGGIAPTHAEQLASLWWKFWAEDRYDKPWQQGRAWLKDLIDELYEADTWEEAMTVVEKCHSSIKAA